ncbi:MULTISPECIES: flagellar basal body rod protein FlgF [Pectobacterium]|uniref:flagellar basal body rod protein FlgF n=1 Tax=Pectobacterium TaxID=122277 RepID=UPI0005829133|nr:MULTISPECIES: flagellar basal body rod protein FlgF [Pectobacterium]KHS84596.1 flagellar basal body rod protein FlgF [Pectobacterium carotovorum subsp. carotovorum]MBA0191885.1 flagellar basal body rod protein FlgF [Pectobacterium carotovorum]MBA0199310.1 flagellar basal body rod protein FlgF [Pectobacterium carotovorum]RUS02481.1 flagellar basal body rod protein FlgF [Pectobacterium polaris]WGL29572.1 flagellar basal body rod protein FlgF [Pectobacterium brasiliense]
MDHAIYTAMGGASQSLEKQAITANNLANASTPGFRAQLSALRAVPVNGLTLPTRTLVVASTPGADMTEGVMNYTGRAMDVALPKESWLAVQTADGGEAYTRNGNMEINADGQLTIQGRVVMGDGGPIDIPPQAQISISADGTISALNAGDPPNTIAQLGRLKLVKATGQEVERSDDGLFRLTQQAQQQRGNVLQNDPTVRIMPGVIEGSNVNTVDTMVDMIANARRFEMQMKIISSVDDNAQRANQILAMG